MSARNWTDQPEELEQAEVLLRFHDEALVELRHKKSEGKFYVTAGNLFGSQTVMCFDFEQACAVARGIVDKNFKGPKDLPQGCVLMKNAEG